MKVFITRKITKEAANYLIQNGIEVEEHQEDSAPERQLLLEKCRTVNGMITLLSDAVDKEFLDTAVQLKVVANYAVGFNNIDVNYARSKGIIITNTPDVLTNATADLTWALLLGVSRRIVEADKYLRAGKFDGWGPLLLLGEEFTGKTLGIFGAGRIGQAVAKRARGFDMRILYLNPRRLEGFERETGAEYVDPDVLFSEADFLSFHCPLTPETQHILNGDSIKKIKKGAYVVNTSRGPIIDERILAKALKDGTLAGAGLDVFENEPEVQQELLEMDNVILLPHIGSATLQARTEMGIIAAKNIVAVLTGKSPLTPVG